MALICKCCKKNARWCGEGEKACGVNNCPQIHCDHCGMHYSLENDAVKDAESKQELKQMMFAAYHQYP